MAVIGSAYVNIRAITDKLESDIRDALSKIQDNISVSVDADISKATSQIEALVASTDEEATIDVTADTTAATERIAAVGDEDVHLNVDADTAEAEAEISGLAALVSRMRARLTVVASTIAARAEIAWLTRPRLSTVIVNVNEASLARVNKTLSIVGRNVASLSGGRVLSDRIRKMVDEFGRLDRMVPGISRMSLIFGTISSLVLNSVAGLLTFGAALGSIINMAGLVAPGMLAGFGTGIGVLIVALTDFKKQLPDVVEQYKTLGQAIKVPFWEIAREPIRDMANTLFPDLKRGIEATAGSLGKWTAELADSVKASFTADRLGVMFGFLTKSIDVASGALSNNVETLATLGIAGGSVLPRLAGWWVDVSDQFNNFITTASKDGRLDKWINDGITNLKELGGVIGATGGIFANLTEAARAAGSDGLTNLLEGLKVFKEITDDSGVQANLTTIFEGAALAADGFLEALARIFGGLGDMAPAIKSAFGDIGGMLVLLGTAIQDILQDDSFQAGFVAMFDGLRAGFEALLPVIGTTGPKFGEIAQVIGLLAENLGGVLGASLETILPLILSFGDVLKPVIEILGDSLIGIIKDLAPTFEVFAKTLSDLSPVISGVVGFLADMVSSLVSGLGPILPGIVVGVLAFAAAMQVMNIVSIVAKGFGMLSTAIKAYRAGLTLATAIQAGFNVALLANPIGLIVAGVVALIAVVVLAYNNIGWFKDFVDGAFKFIGDVVKNTVTWIGDNWKMLLGFLTGPIGTAIFFITENWGAISTMFTDFFNNTVGMFADFFSNTVGMFSDFFSNTVGMFSDFFSNTVGMFSDFFGNIGEFFGGIGESIGGAFSGAEGFVTDAINNISKVISDVMGTVSEVWNTAWQGISDFFIAIWQHLSDYFEPLINFYVTLITSVVRIVTTVWKVGWEIISTIFIGVWTNIVRFFTTIIQWVQDTISLTVETISVVWNAMWQAIGDFFMQVWNNIVAFVTPIFQSISDAITLGLEVINVFWTTIWQAISDFFSTIWNNMVAFLGPIFQGISDAITIGLDVINVFWTTTWQAIGDFFKGIWDGIVSFLRPKIAAVSSAITTAVSAVSTFWNNTWSSIKNFFSAMWEGIVNAARVHVAAVRDNINNVLQFFSGLPGAILSKVSGFGNLLYNAGADLLRGLANGITNMTDWVVSKVTNVGASIVDKLKSFFGIQSPSKVMREQIGMMIGKGLAQGIEQSVDVVGKATDRMMEAATPTLPTFELAGSSAPALTTSMIRPSNQAMGGGSGVFGTSGNYSGGGVNVIVNPSTGLDERQIGRIAANELLWQIKNR